MPGFTDCTALPLTDKDPRKTLPALTARLSERTRAASYIALLLGVNIYFVHKLFFVDFTDNMRTNAGTFMAISRFIIQHWPHLDWFPWWFSGVPFENTYTPMLHLIDAAFAFIFHCSTPRAFNFVTGLFFITGPVFLFLFAWQVSKFLETSFLAALFYSLFSPAAIFPFFRNDLGSWWNSWRLRLLVYYGEGPHTTVLATLPLALLLVYFALTRRAFIWKLAAGLAMAFVPLVNAFGAVDLAVGCGCLILAMAEPKEMARAALKIATIALSAYLLASPYLTPTLIRTIAADSQQVGGDFSAGNLSTSLWLTVPCLVCLWFAARQIDDYLTRFSLMFAFVFFEVVALAVVAHVSALPQPHRYGGELEPAIALALALSLRPLILRLPHQARVVALLALLALATHQVIHYRRDARFHIQKFDVTQTIEYKTAKWLDQNMHGLRVFGGSQTGTWMNAFTNTPQMNAGHDPFDPNFAVVEEAVFTIYSGQNAGARDAEVSILWLKAFGCHAISVPGPMSRVYEKPFVHPEKFQGVLPVLWREEDDTIYGVPQRSTSLAHVMPENAIVQHQPINGLDVAEISTYVATLNDPALPETPMTWISPAAAHITANLRPGQVISIQSSYDKGWVASANGRPAPVTRDGLGLTVIHAGCNGPCSVDFVFDGGLERKLCRAASWTVAICALAWGLVAFKRRTLY